MNCRISIITGKIKSSGRRGSSGSWCGRGRSFSRSSIWICRWFVPCFDNFLFTIFGMTSSGGPKKEKILFYFNSNFFFPKLKLRAFLIIIYESMQKREQIPISASCLVGFKKGKRATVWQVYGWQRKATFGIAGSSLEVLFLLWCSFLRDAKIASLCLELWLLQANKERDGNG